MVLSAKYGRTLLGGHPPPQDAQDVSGEPRRLCRRRLARPPPHLHPGSVRFLLTNRLLRDAPRNSSPAFPPECRQTAGLQIALCRFPARDRWLWGVAVWCSSTGVCLGGGVALVMVAGVASMLFGAAVLVAKENLQEKKREENVQDDSPRVSSQPSSSFSDSGSSFVLSLSVCCFINSSPSEEIVCRMENFVTSARLVRDLRRRKTCLNKICLRSIRL